MDGGSVDVHVRVQDDTRRGVEQAKAQVRGLQREVQQAGVAMDRSFAAAAVRTGVAAAAAYALTQNIQHLGIEGQRAAGLLQNLGRGDVIGAVQAAGQTVKLTDQQVHQLGTTSTKTTAEIGQLADMFVKWGVITDQQREKVIALRKEMNDLNALQAWQRQNIVSNLQGGMQATFGITPLDTTAVFDPKGTLNLWRRQQTALAATTPGKADDIAETRKNIAYLQKLTKDTRIRDEERTNLYQELAQQQQTLATLTAKPPAKTAAGKEPSLLPPGLAMQLAKAHVTLQNADDDLRVLKKIDDYLTRKIATTKNIDRKTRLLEEQAKYRSEAQALMQAQSGTTTSVAVNAAGVLGQLGQGPFLTSSVAQFAQQYGYRPGARDYLRDIRSQVQAGVRLDRNLGVLRKRGLGDTAIAELAGQGLGGADMVAALAKAPQALIRQYGRAAERREDIAARVQTITATVQTANIIIRNGTVKGIDRNGDGAVNAKDKTAAKLRGV